MPESKSRRPRRPEGQPDTPVPVRLDSPGWLVPVMVTSFLIGLAYIVVFYLAGPDIPVMRDLNALVNVLIGFAFIAVGFILATRWR